MVACSILASCFAGEAISSEGELTEQDYAVWRDHVLPVKIDGGWQEIPWEALNELSIICSVRRDVVRPSEQRLFTR